MVRAGLFAKVSFERRFEEGKGTSHAWGGAFQLEGLASGWSRGSSGKAVGEERANGSGPWDLRRLGTERNAKTWDGLSRGVTKSE